MAKNPSQKRAGGVAQGADPEFKPSTTKKEFEITLVAKVIMWNDSKMGRKILFRVIRRF
jgi:hypothetical protein